MAIKALVVDDDSLTGELLKEMLGMLGVDTTIANKGSQAKEQVVASRFDLILLDLKLPDMDGLQVLDFIRKHSNNQDTGVVVTSGFEDTEEIERCREVGCQAFLAKPFTFEQLCDVVTPLMSRS